ncbi:hypothetical protein CFIO01_08183 [Colletotrichum fioriniae PJ7]|uniref:Uncharacterized protein n=1 Tax=Colletotrichum fioriniae PJ7 TaxID=1445577 RepID=A0A010RPC0_9PEZI|nr:hypothetical protein CFIO01_08183 [Colletotrichum fioriniae PJ7]
MARPSSLLQANDIGDNASLTYHIRSAKLLKYHADHISFCKAHCNGIKLQRAFMQLKADHLATKVAILSQADQESIGPVLDCAVRLMFMTACQPGGAVLGSYRIHEWNDEETLPAFLRRVYPQAFAGGTPEQPINMENFSAYILSKNARVFLKATDVLSDHLSLIIGEGFKTLLVFHHRAFLEHSLEVLKTDGEDLSQSLPEAVSIGCLDPTLLQETLRTFDLLFPPSGDGQSRRILEKWVQKEDLDLGLLEPGHTLLEISAEDKTPDDLQELYMQYPHWAPRLARLLKEVDDPTPTTRWERYAERRKSPRHMYKCALAAFIVAAIIGILATVLAAVQVWISYCAWVDDPMKSLCGAKRTQTSPTLDGRFWSPM